MLKKFGWLERDLAADGVTVRWLFSAGSNKANELISSDSADFASTAGSAAYSGCRQQRATSGIMWVSFAHLRPPGHIMPDHGVIEARYSWSWCLTITSISSMTGRSSPGAALHRHAVGPIVRGAMTGPPATRGPLDNRAPARRHAW